MIVYLVRVFSIMELFGSLLMLNKTLQTLEELPRIVKLFSNFEIYKALWSF
jgi:hypothetical protein